MLTLLSASVSVELLAILWFNTKYKLQNKSRPHIVKQVSWFKSSLLLRIQIKYTNKLRFLIKTKDSIFHQKVYTTDEKRAPSMAWVGLNETDSILIKEKCNHLSKCRTGSLENVLECKRSRFE